MMHRVEKFVALKDCNFLGKDFMQGDMVDLYVSIGKVKAYSLDAYLWPKPQITIDEDLVLYFFRRLSNDELNIQDILE